MNEIMFRKRAVRNMWIIFATIFIVVTYNTIYSFVLYWGSDENCFIANSELVRSFMDILSRAIQFILWLYPVMWLFWPAELSCRKPKLQSNQKLKNIEQADENRSHDSDNSSDETANYNTPSSTSYVNLQNNAAGMAMFGGPSSSS